MALLEDAGAAGGVEVGGVAAEPGGGGFDEVAVAPGVVVLDERLDGLGFGDGSELPKEGLGVVEHLHISRVSHM